MSGNVVRLGLEGAPLETFDDFVNRARLSAKVETTIFHGWECSLSYLSVRPEGRWRFSARPIDAGAMIEHRTEFLRKVLEASGVRITDVGNAGQVASHKIRFYGEQPDRDGRNHWSWDV